MKTIVPAANLVKRILGAQKKRENAAYRLLDFCVQCPVEDGVLLYNAMTLELLLLSPEEADKLTESEELISKWFLVPEEQDDRLLADQLRDLAAHLQKPKEHITGYTIFTTTDCNARCYYCFEHGFTRKHMSRDTAERLVRYITEHSGGNQVHLRWFGGEPLFNQTVIDVICEGLTEAGVSYRSSMISNGYLFDEDTVGKAVTSWKLNHVQITLDGTEEAYNRIKAYIYADASPFRRVLNSIDLLLKAGIEVNVRLNVSEENWQDLLLLSEQLAERFGGREGFQVYAHPLYERVASGQGESEWARTRNLSLVEKYWEIQDRLAQLQLYRGQRLLKRIRTNHCMADNDGSVTVSPDGSLGRCEHYAESELFGHIDRPERDEAMLANWKKHTPPGPECPGCTYYPQCIHLEKCFAGRTCAAYEREDYEKQLREQILNEYRIYTEKQAEKEEESDLPPENC